MERFKTSDIKNNATLTRFYYTPNLNGMRFLEILALFFTAIASMIYPVTKFEPRAWMVAPILLGATAITLFSLVQYWRAYAKKSFVAYDDTHIYIVNMGKGYKIAWSKFTIQNSGIATKNERAGVFEIRIDDRKTLLRLFSSFVWLEDFQNLLGELLTHIKENEEKSG